MRSRKRTFIVKSLKNGISLPYEELEDFCKGYPNKTIFLRVEVAPTEPSAKVKSYYWNYIIPEMLEVMREVYGEIKFPNQLDKWLREQCPICYDEGKVRDFGVMDSAECNAYLEWLIQFAAENFNKILDDPR